MILLTSTDTGRARARKRFAATKPSAVRTEHARAAGTESAGEAAGVLEVVRLANEPARLSSENSAFPPGG